MPPCVLQWKRNDIVESPTIISPNTLISMWHMERQRRQWQVQQQWSVRRGYSVHAELWLKILQMFGLFYSVHSIVSEAWWQINLMINIGWMTSQYDGTIEYLGSVELNHHKRHFLGDLLPVSNKNLWIFEDIAGCFVCQLDSQCKHQKVSMI